MNENMNENPLVSVVVITYNSALYILDTLTSIIKQTYSNIELIITDDKSTDSTPTLCNEWIKENGDFFKRCVFVSMPENRGVAPNINNGFKAAKGTWVKVVSGDDKLLPDAINNYVEYIRNNVDCKILYSKMHFFGDDAEYVNKQKLIYETNFDAYIKQSYKSQFKLIQERLFVPGPGLFYNREFFWSIGGMDERFPFADEYPITYNILEAGERIHYLDKESYSYHIRKESLCRTSNENFSGPHPRVFKSQYNYIKKVLVWKVLKHGHPLLALHILISNYRISLLYANAPSYKRIVAKLLVCISPYSIVISLINRFQKCQK